MTDPKPNVPSDQKSAPVQRFLAPQCVPDFESFYRNPGEDDPEVWYSSPPNLAQSDPIPMIEQTDEEIIQAYRASLSRKRDADASVQMSDPDAIRKLSLDWCMMPDFPEPIYPDPRRDDPEAWYGALPRAAKLSLVAMYEEHRKNKNECEPKK